MQTTMRERDIIQRLVSSGVAYEFEATARRNFLLGFWAGGLIGLDDCLAYAIELNDLDLAAAGRNDMFFKLRADLEAVGIIKNDPELHAIATVFLNQAADNILGAEMSAA